LAVTLSPIEDRTTFGMEDQLLQPNPVGGINALPTHVRDLIWLPIWVWWNRFR